MSVGAESFETVLIAAAMDQENLARGEHCKLSLPLWLRGRQHAPKS
jgi:hypothetical protein